MTQVIAKLRYLHIAPRKVRLVAGLIQGLSFHESLIQLAHLPKRASRPMEKLLRSAAANAKHNFNLDEKNLRVKRVLVDGGPVSKRIEPRAFGRGAVVRKRMSHVTLTLDEAADSLQRSRRPRARKQAPLVRRASINELSAIRKEDHDSDRRESVEKIRVKPRAGAVRRFFQRKAI